MRQNKNSLFYVGESGLGRTDDFINFADQDWIGSGLDSDWKISQSAHLCYLCILIYTHSLYSLL